MFFMINPVLNFLFKEAGIVALVSNHLDVNLMIFGYFKLVFPEFLLHYLFVFLVMFVALQLLGK